MFSAVWQSQKGIIFQQFSTPIGTSAANNTKPPLKLIKNLDKSNKKAFFFESFLFFAIFATV